MTAPADTLDVSRLFEPVDIGSLRLRNRFLLTSTHLGRYTLQPAKHLENLCSYVGARAAGGSAAIVMTSIGQANVDAQPLADTSDGWVRDHPDDLRAVVRAAHEHGAYLGMQLKHMGARAIPGAAERWAPSPVVPDGHPLPSELTGDQILRVIERFGRSAALMKEQGFDFVEIHGGHGFLVNEFLSPRFNLRVDEWGGREGGVRFLKAVIRSIRAAVGDDTPISLRVSSSERASGGLDIEDMVQFLSSIVGEVDLINVSGGTVNSLPGIVPLYSSPYAFNVGHAAQLKRALGIPVAAVGRLWQPERMVQAVEDGSTDLVGLARALWADPELPNKIRDGRFEEVRPAIGCNQGCIDRSDEVVRTCLVNPSVGREHEVESGRARISRRIAVVGAGVAGLEVARIAATRGHQVTVFEQTTEPGGRWRLAARVPGKQEFTRYLDWLVRACLRVQVELRLGVRFDPPVEDPDGWDVVVIAAGGTRTAPRSPAVHLVSADMAVASSWLVGRQVLVDGADQLQAEAALLLASTGRDVTLRPAGGGICSDAGPSVQRSTHRLLIDLGVVIEEGPPAQDRSAFDTVVVPDAVEAPTVLIDSVAQRFSEWHVVGDASGSWTGLEAIREATELAATL